MNLSFISANSGVTIMWVVIIILISIVGIIFCIRGIRREHVRFLEVNGSNAILNKEDFDSFIAKKMTAASHSTKFCLIQVDIAEHKALIKSFGDVQYSSIIREMADRFFALVSAGSKISHYEKDSFLIYVKQKFQVDDLDNISKIMLLEIKKALVLSPTLSVELSANIGVVAFPTSGNKMEELMQNLELALIDSKRKGINTYKVYSQDLRNRSSEEYQYYKEIKEAIDKKEFSFFYQPLVDLTSLEVVGAEGLLRWNHPTQGVLPPSKFLHIMESTGDINWVGFWSFDQMVKQFIQWKTSYPDINLTLSVNLSAKQLVNPELVDEMRRIVKKHKVLAENFTMEIIEFELFDKLDVVSDNIYKLKQIGFKIAIDNYGLEFSTLNLLEKLPIDIIKLNKTFVQKTKESTMSANIVGILVGFAKEHSLTIIAEGVEDMEGVQYVKSLGINLGQGYAFAAPKDSKEFISDAILTPWSN